MEPAAREANVRNVLHSSAFIFATPISSQSVFGLNWTEENSKGPLLLLTQLHGGLP